MMHPGARLAQQEQRLDDLEQRLLAALRGALQDTGSRVNEALVAAVRSIRPNGVVQRVCACKYEALASAAAERLRRAAVAVPSTARARRAHARTRVSPLATLDRGFAIVTRAADGALRD